MNRKALEDRGYSGPDTILVHPDLFEDKARKAVAMLPSDNHNVVTHDTNVDRSNKDRPLCWLPLVIVENKSGGDKYASAALTALFLSGKQFKKKYDQPISEMEAAAELTVACELKSNAISLRAREQFAIYCTAFNSLASAELVETTSGPPKIYQEFELWESGIRASAPHWVGHGLGHGSNYNLKVCLVAPVITTHCDGGSHPLGEDGERNVTMYEYSPFTIAEARQFERILRITSSVDNMECYPIKGRLPVCQWRNSPRVLFIPRSRIDEWREGLLFDSGIRLSEEYGDVAYISKRMETTLYELPSVATLKSNSANSNSVRFGKGSMYEFYGSPIQDPTTKEQAFHFPCVEAAERVARIQHSVHLSGTGNEGIPPSSYTEDVETEAGRSPMFVETWKDTRGILLVDLSDHGPAFYHEFIRCTTCNGEVEVRAPKDYTPPETECPHCDTKGGISWKKGA